MNKTYTSTLPSAVFEWLNHTAQEMGITKKKIILTALKHYQTELKRKKMAQGFQQAAQDKDILQLTDSHDFSL